MLTDVRKAAARALRRAAAWVEPEPRVRILSVTGTSFGSTGSAIGGGGGGRPGPVEVTLIGAPRRRWFRRT